MFSLFFGTAFDIPAFNFFCVHRCKLCFRLPMSIQFPKNIDQEDRSGNGNSQTQEQSCQNSE